MPGTLTLTPLASGSLSAAASTLGSIGLSVTPPGVTTFFNVRDYGALGDGTTDDTAAIAAAIADMPVSVNNTGSGILFFPPGDYRHRGITPPANRRMAILGAGAAVSTLRLLSSVNGDSLTLPARTGATDGWWYEVSGLQIDGNKAGNSTGHGITVLSTRTFIHHCNITNAAQDGIHSAPTSFALSSSGNRLEQLYITTNGGNGVYLGHEGYDPFLSNLFITLNGGDGIQSLTTNVFAENIHSAENTLNGIGLVGTAGGYGFWSNVYAHLNTLRGISISGSGETGHQFATCQVIGNSTGGIYIAPTSGRVTVAASVVKDNIGPGVEIASCNNNIIDVNAFDFQTPKTQTYGVLSTGTADYNVVRGIVRDADHLTAGLSLVGSHNTVYAAGQALSPNDRIQANQSVTILGVSGTPSDGSFTTAPPDNTLAFDTNGARFYVRSGGGTWKGSQVLVGAPIQSKTANYSASSNDETLIGDSTGGAFTFTLPTAAAAGVAGRRYTIKKKDASVNGVIVATTSAQTIDGAATKTLGSQWAFITVCSDGTNWIIVATGGTVT